MTHRPPVSGEPSTDYAGRWFFHAHGSECEPVCVLERIAKGTWEPVEARATPPSLDRERLAEAIWTASNRHDEHPWIDVGEQERSETLEWAGEIAAEYARLTSKERCARFRHDEHCAH